MNFLKTLFRNATQLTTTNNIDKYNTLREKATNNLKKVVWTIQYSNNNRLNGKLHELIEWTFFGDAFTNLISSKFKNDPSDQEQQIITLTFKILENLSSVTTYNKLSIQRLITEFCDRNYNDHKSFDKTLNRKKDWDQASIKNNNFILSKLQQFSANLDILPQKKILSNPIVSTKAQQLFNTLKQSQLQTQNIPQDETDQTIQQLFSLVIGDLWSFKIQETHADLQHAISLIALHTHKLPHNPKEDDKVYNNRKIKYLKTQLDELNNILEQKHKLQDNEITQIINQFKKYKIVQ